MYEAGLKKNEKVNFAAKTQMWWRRLTSRTNEPKNYCNIKVCLESSCKAFAFRFCLLQQIRAKVTSNHGFFILRFFRNAAFESSGRGQNIDLFDLSFKQIDHGRQSLKFGTIFKTLALPQEVVFGSGKILPGLSCTAPRKVKPILGHVYLHQPRFQA